jgi:glycosyltransferase involved in cell wall biosynthesis
MREKGLQRRASDTPTDLSVIIPVFNEEENVRALHTRLKAVLDEIGRGYEIIFVDDGSQDDTFGVLVELSAGDENIRIVRLRMNCGQTAGLAAGFDHSRGEVIISMDGDLQHAPEEIPAFLEKIAEGFDVATGWRHERRDNFWSRRLPSKIANWITRKVSGVQIHDFGTTFRAYRREVLKDVHLYGELHRFVPALLGGVGATIAEVPISNPDRGAGVSNYGITRTFKVILDILMVKYLISYSKRPLHLFGGLGMLFIGIGFVLGMYLLVMKILGDPKPLLTVTVLTWMVGLNMLTIGVLAEMILRSYYEGQDKRIYAVSTVIGTTADNADVGQGGSSLTSHGGE